MKTISLKNIFRIIAFLEGLSYILLLLAMPVKYILHNEKYVQILGMPHGVLFIFYIFFAIAIQRKMKWNIKTMLFVLSASIVPFGTFYIEYKYFKK
ncbi:MAG: hypothetical protein CMD26_05370 [Flavobacteriales bacterium]|nr:hypothetical protein [Flavobacteriales bacterium]|tara:strand:+ start:6104 stop:6391 length:288 start_codon:yes stop_codon:yes gene_type:complete